MSTINYLSEEILSHVFSFLQPEDLKKCAGVGRLWRRLSEDDLLWKKICQRMYPGIPFPNKDIKEHFFEIQSLTVTNHEELFERMYQFLERVGLFNVGELTCEFPFNPKYSISLKLAHGHDRIEDQEPPRYRERIFFAKKLPPEDGFVGSNTLSKHFKTYTSCRIVKVLPSNFPLILIGQDNFAAKGISIIENLELKRARHPYYRAALIALLAAFYVITHSTFKI